MVYDNGKTFKSASTIIEDTLKTTGVRRYFADLHIEWKGRHGGAGFLSIW